MKSAAKKPKFLPLISPLLKKLENEKEYLCSYQKEKYMREYKKQEANLNS